MQRSDHYHVACRVDVRRIPSISRHNNFVRQPGLVDRVSHVDAALQNPGSLANDDETRIGALFQNETSCFNENELAFIWANHTNVPNERNVVVDADFTAEFYPVARRLEFFQIDS